MKSRTNVFWHFTHFLLPAVTLLCLGATAFLYKENVALREQLSSNSGASVYASTSTEATARIILELSAKYPAPDPIAAVYRQDLGLCEGGLREEERSALSESFIEKMNYSPELVISWSGTSDSAAEREQVSKIIGAKRYSGVEATCRSLERARRNQESESAILTLSGYYGLSQSLTEQIRDLVRERISTIETFVPQSGASRDAQTIQALDEYKRKSNELDRRFRALLGPDLWKRYKTDVLPGQAGQPLPVLYWLESLLFSLPEDEAREESSNVDGQ